jgi:hypothetical protein
MAAADDAKAPLDLILTPEDWSLRPGRRWAMDA